MKRFLALGDSYTIGECVAETERWPVQLVRLLRAEGVNIEDPTIIARTGWTTAELNNGMDQSPLQGSYDLVSLLIGVNNQYRRYNLESYREEFVALLQRAVALADGQFHHLIVLSIPNWGLTPFAEGSDRAAITADIRAFNRVNQAEARRTGAHYIDITAAWESAGNDPSFIADDGLHPSGKMYALWAQLVLPVARLILGIEFKNLA